MNLKLAPIALAALVAITSGCTSAPTYRQTSVLVAPPSHPLDELRAAALESRDEMRTLAKIIEARNAPSLTPQQHAQKHYQAVVVPPGFDRVDSFIYRGPATNAARALAAVSGYSFKVRGNPVANEPWVTIKTNRLPLNEALRELGVQTGSAMRVEVDGASKTLVIVYN
ncbi:DotD/TraH family lipoprotein [Pseudomonas aeruginosa]